MISRWVIYSSLMFLGTPAPPYAPAGGVVSGQVELTNSHDPAVHKRNYSGVVLWLEPLDHAAPMPVGVRARIEQRDKHFIPHVVAVPVGGIVDFPNLDPFYHNAFSNFSGHTFDLGLYKPNTTKSEPFKHPGIVRVFCQIHATMSAVIAVVATPYYTVTPESGKFTIPNVPPGEYQLHLFHERAVSENLRFLEHRLTIPADGLTLPLISISETGYVPEPHVNKYGKPYPPADGTYKGGGQ
jgi:plastocyanin